jgi:hypothetical protein
MRTISGCLLLIMMLVACHSESARPGEDPTLIYGRPWLEAKPSRDRDFVHAMFVAPQAPVGIFQRASAFEARLELFRYQRQGNTMRLRFPQSGRGAELSYRITACDELPPFDLCLDVSKNPWGGPKRYYGMRRARRDDIAALGDRMAAELPSE